MLPGTSRDLESETTALLSGHNEDYDDDDDDTGDEIERSFIRGEDA